MRKGGKGLTQSGLAMEAADCAKAQGRRTARVTADERRIAGSIAGAAVSTLNVRELGGNFPWRTVNMSTRDGRQGRASLARPGRPGGLTLLTKIVVERLPRWVECLPTA